MDIRRIILTQYFWDFYEGLSGEEQRQVDYALSWIEFERKFPTPNVIVPKEYDNLFEIHVPSLELDIRVMAFAVEADFTLYLAHGFAYDDDTRLPIEYIKAEQIKEGIVHT